MHDEGVVHSLCADALCHRAAEQLDPDGATLIGKAIGIAEAVHYGQRRRSGGAFLCHPLAVSAIIWELGLTADPIAAAVLHDVIETSRELPTSYCVGEEQLWDAFPYPLHIVAMVQALTKPPIDDPGLTQYYSAIALAAQVEGTREVPLIKAADVWHNVKTVDDVGPANWSWRQAFLEKTRRHSLPWLQRIKEVVTAVLLEPYGLLLERIEQELARHSRELAAAS